MLASLPPPLSEEAQESPFTDQPRLLKDKATDMPVVRETTLATVQLPKDEFQMPHGAQPLAKVSNVGEWRRQQEMNI